MKRRTLVLASIIVALVLGGGLLVYSQLSALSYTALIERLRGAGAAVTPAGEVQQPFFSVTGKMLEVNGEDVQTFEYTTTIMADLDARQVAPDGTAVGKAIHIGWVAPPHFYMSGRLIVLYVGSTNETLTLLRNVLGSQFAGQ
jgi:hypothetical protein